MVIFFALTTINSLSTCRFSEHLHLLLNTNELFYKYLIIPKDKRTCIGSAKMCYFRKLGNLYSLKVLDVFQIYYVMIDGVLINF